jgi:hypothetical protein
MDTIDDGLAGYFAPEEWLIAKTDTVSWQDVRRALEGFTGRLLETVFEQREQR